MSFNAVIAEPPRLTFEERQILIRRALELDDPPLSALMKNWLRLVWRSIMRVQVPLCCSMK